MDDIRGGKNGPQSVLLEAFAKLTSREVSELFSLVTEGAARKGFTYQRHGGRIETIQLMLLPTFFTDPQVAYLHGVSRAVKRGVEAVWKEYFNDSEIQRLLPLNPVEYGWLKGLKPVGPDGGPEGGVPLWYRLDAHAHMKESDWKDGISVFEINACAVGGIHYSPVAESLFSGIILPFLKPRLPKLPPIRKNPDLRDLLFGLMEHHAAAIGRKTLTVVFSEDTTLEEGITEGPYIVEYLRSKGVAAHLADPRDLYVKEDDLFYRDDPVDMVYRNFELGDMIEMEENGDNIEGVKFAFSNNRVISSLAGDLDHKSMWEVLACGRFDKYFSKEDAAVFKKHLLWTRTVAERRTEGPLGPVVDLAGFMAKNRETLVLKPNRLFGGTGVTIGRNASAGDWERLIDEALKEEGHWVVQSFNAPERAVFPLFEGDRLVFEDHNIVYGFSSTSEGTGVLGRVSKEDVVNVAQQGGMMPVMRV
ncbi:MAG: hypothetical protein HY891_08020 [Deltaproteobacteria bacterium]|nr:hypothetical protein [Deltaproteobacteria bacterium]